jgi:dolichyl-phosphate-mannose-protein mannosyltransferase
VRASSPAPSAVSPATQPRPDLGGSCPPETPGRPSLVARAIVVLLVSLLALLAVLLVIGSLESYATVKARLDSFASDGNADLTRGHFDAIVVNLRLAAAASAIAAVAVFGARRRLWRFLDELGLSIAGAVTGLRQRLARAVALESSLHLGALLLATGIGLLVRLNFLFQPMRYDESVTYVHYASRPWYVALTTYTAPNNHVFHSLLVHVSTSIFGSAPWAIRLPALLAGVLLVPASYLTARLLYGRRAALLGAGLVASSSALVEYSTNARGYTILALIFLLLLALATRLRASWSHAEWLAFAVLAALGFWTVPVMLYAFGTVVVWLAVSIVQAGEKRLVARRLVPSVALAGMLSLLLYAPIVAASGLHSLVANEFVGSRSWSYVRDELPHSIAALVRSWHRDIPLPLAAVLGVGFVLALVLRRRLSRVSFSPALAALLWIIPVVLAQRVVPFGRVWLFLLPLYLITAAAGVLPLLGPLARKVGHDELLVVVLAIALTGSLAGNAVATDAVYRSEDTSTFRDSAAVAAFLAARLHPGDKILVAPPADAILEYQLDRRGLDPAALLYWSSVGKTRHLFVVVKIGPRDYRLPHLLHDPRIAGAQHTPPSVVHRFPAASVYELRLGSQA